MIEARNLSKAYGETLAVDDLSFTVEAGQVTGFLGPNGSGKSTTMRMIVGLDAPTSGAVTVGGRTYGSIPVSYTHLDVYKRQSLWSPCQAPRWLPPPVSHPACCSL